MVPKGVPNNLWGLVMRDFYSPDALTVTETDSVKATKKFDDIFSRLYTKYERDGRTDRRTDTGRQLVPRLRIASRGKNYKIKL